MASLRLELGNAGKDGSRKVYILISHSGQRKKIPTELRIEKSELSKNGKSIKSVEKSAMVEQMRSTLQDRIYKLSALNIGYELTLDQIIETITAKDEGIDFFAFMDEWLANNPVKGVKNYKTLRNKLNAFVGSDKLDFSQINFDFLTRFEHSMDGKPRAQSLYLGLLRHLFREAMRQYNTEHVQRIPFDPFTRYRVPKQQIKKGVRSLTVDELMRIYHYKPTGIRSTVARDCFILSFCLMGINTADLYEAKTLKMGKLCYERQKTKDRRSDGAYIEVDIHPIIQDLVDKYKDNVRAFDFHRKYCKASELNRSVNIGLKIIGEDVGIENLQYYQARHTFASLSRNLMGFSKGDVDEALNHVGSYDLADVYIKKDFSIINRNNFALLDRIFGEK